MTFDLDSAHLPATEEILNRIGSDLSIVADVSLRVEGVEAQPVTERPAGEGVIHVSFRLDFLEPEGAHQGCVLLPLADVQVLAGGLQMQSAMYLSEARDSQELDEPSKEAVMELGTFVAGATESALRDQGHALIQVQHQGCQGVRPDVRPRLNATEDAPLVWGTCRATLAEFPTSTWHLLLPRLKNLG